MEKTKKSLAYPKPLSISKLPPCVKEKEVQTHVICYCAGSDVPIYPSQVTTLVNHVLTFKEVTCDEVICHFVDLTTISALHRDFFDDPTPTDCISFPLDTPKTYSCGSSTLGEIFVCPQVALDYAASHQIDPYREISLYLVHGLLHLMGYTDATTARRAKMRQEEKACLCYLEEKKALLTP